MSQFIFKVISIRLESHNIDKEISRKVSINDLMTMIYEFDILLLVI